MLGWLPKVTSRTRGRFPLSSPFYTNRTKGRQKEKDRPQKGKRKKNGQIEVAVEQVGEQRMQVDGFTGGVSLTDRISGGFNIKDGRSNQAQDPRRPSTTPPTLWTVAKTPARRLVLNNKRSGSANNPTNNVDLFHRQRLPRLPSYILLHSLQTRRVRMGCDKSTRLVRPVDIK